MLPRVQQFSCDKFNKKLHKKKVFLVLCLFFQIFHNHSLKAL